ncbi:MAG: ABC transporter ATP-binding protein [Deltaproteobacteria bacterium]|nr:ABC transporter ATP-binding protein [Deltaproteobacteria bacterium]
MGEVLVDVQGVHKSFQLGQTQVHALRGLDLQVQAGEFTAVVGASGSGKSTLLNLIGCLDEPDEGRIVLGGQDISHLDDAARCTLRNRKIGYIFQAFNLVPVLSVAENVELPLLLHDDLAPKDRADRVAQALADVQLTEFAPQFPDRLSGGQRQRVAIARALVTRPALVLADEPTANLDSETTGKLVDLMVDLNQKRGVTFLFSTHDEKLMSRVARVVRIRDGKVAEGAA